MTWASRFEVTSTLAVIFLAAVAGFWWLEHQPARDHKNVALVCPDTFDFSRLLDLSKEQSGKGIDLFVWRGVPVGPGDYARLDDALIGKTAGLVSGTTSGENASLDGATIVIPGAIRNILLIPSKRDFFQPGAGAIGRTLNPLEFADTSWVPLINWEAGDPRLVRAAAAKQIQVNLAMVDPLQGGPGATEQLFANLRLWSVSFGRPLIFASTKNLSAIVTRSGKDCGRGPARVGDGGFDGYH